MEVNFIVLLVAALIPLIIGFIWYNPKVFGNAWMKEAGMTEDKMKGGNMARTFIMTYILSLFAAVGITLMVVHQYHLWSMLQDIPNFNDEASPSHQLYNDLMARWGHEFRSIRHGMFHGVLGGIVMALPIIGINAMFERKSARYIFINAGFWIVSFALMGGVICEWV